MRKATSTSFGRILLALVAVLVVAGPGVVLAGGGNPSYAKPKFAQVVGNTIVAPSGTATYSLKVTFTDGTITTFTGAPAVFSTVLGSIDSTGNYTAPSSTGRDRITGSYSQDGVTVTGNKTVFIQ
jgi:hypothetical protein